MTRKALVSIGVGPMHDVLTESLNTFRQFARVHSYDIVIGTADRADGRASAWGKIPLLRQLLDSYDHVLWIDADAIILDWSVDPVSLLPEDSYQALVVNRVRDWEIPCTGVWLLRSTSKSRAFLDAVWATTADDHWKHPWEQASVTRLLGYSVESHEFVGPTEWTNGTTWLDEEWDCLPIFTPARRLTSCRIRHYGAVPNRVRRRQMRADQHAMAADRSVGPRSLMHRALAVLGSARWTLLTDVENDSDVPDLRGRLRWGVSKTRAALKEWVLPTETKTRRLPVGLARGLRIQVNFANQTRLYLGLYETELNPHLRRLCRSGFNVFDVGGQYGYDALLMAKLTGGRVLSVDCEPEAIQTMEQNFAANPRLAQTPVARMARIGADSESETTTLDDLARRTFVPDFVKIDVEGAEADVLRGADGLLSGRRPSVIVEVHSEDIELECTGLLAHHGYRPLVVNQRRWFADHRPIEHNRWLVAEGR